MENVIYLNPSENVNLKFTFVIMNKWPLYFVILIKINITSLKRSFLKLPKINRYPLRLERISFNILKLKKTLIFHRVSRETLNLQISKMNHQTLIFVSRWHTALGEIVLILTKLMIFTAYQLYKTHQIEYERAKL